MFNLNLTVAGLISQLIGVPIAGRYYLSGKLQLPTIPEGSSASSQVVVTITQTPNAGSPTTIYTGLAGAEGFGVQVQAAALDVFSISMTSAAAVDNAINAVKTSISIG